MRTIDVYLTPWLKAVLLIQLYFLSQYTMFMFFFILLDLRVVISVSRT